jgi:hypothetical protein
MFESELCSNEIMDTHGALRYPSANNQEIHGVVPLGLARELGTVWQVGDPITEVHQACQIMEDAGKVILAAALASSGSVKHNDIPSIVQAAKTVNSDWEYFNPTKYVRGLHPSFQWKKEGAFDYETCIRAGVGAIALARTLETLVHNTIPLEQAKPHQPKDSGEESYLTYRFPVHLPAKNIDLQFINHNTVVSAVSVTTVRPIETTASNFTIKLEASNGVETILQINCSLSTYEDDSDASSALYASKIQQEQVNGTTLSLARRLRPGHIIWQAHDALRATRLWRKLNITTFRPPEDNL